MASEGSGRGELTQLVSDHVLRDIDGNEALSVVHGDGLADKIRRDHGRSGPGLDDGLFVALYIGFHLAAELVMDVGSFFSERGILAYFFLLSMMYLFEAFFGARVL